MRNPAAPERQGVRQRQVGAAAVDARVVLPAEDEFGAFLLGQDEAGHCGVVFDLQCVAARQAQSGLAVGGETHRAVVEAGVGGRARIVMTHGAAQVDRHLAADRTHAANQQGQVVLLTDGQQVSDFHHGVIAEPAGLQHVGVGR